jgi:hypothetical protein
LSTQTIEVDSNDTTGGGQWLAGLAGALLDLD